MAKMNKEKRNQILKEATINNLGYVDSHAHLSEIMKKDVDFKSLLEKLKEQNYLILDIAIEANDIKDRYDLLKDYKNIYFSTGVGPWGVKTTKEENSNLINFLKENINNYPIKAIGEIGLDNYWNYGSPELQEDLFIKQIELANEYNLPTLIHNREADEQTQNIIKNYNFSKNGIIHCFSATKEFAKIALDKGFYISFASTITYKKNEELREILKYIPNDKLLLETDAPYLSPEPFRGKTNTPLLIPLAYKKAAEIRKTSVEEICTNVRRNLLTLLDCPLV